MLIYQLIPIILKCLYDFIAMFSTLCLTESPSLSFQRKLESGIEFDKPL